MRSNMYTNENNDLSKRQEHLRNGTILSAYQLRFPIQKRGGREKMIIRSNFNSFVAMHNCYHCIQVYVPVDIARIAHFRSYNKYVGDREYSTTLTNRTGLLQQKLHQLFD